MAEDTAEGLKDAIRVDTAKLRGHVDAVVRSSVEETLRSALMLVATRLQHIASTKWGKRRYLAMATLLQPLPQEAAA